MQRELPLGPGLWPRRRSGGGARASPLPRFFRSLLLFPLLPRPWGSSAGRVTPSGARWSWRRSWKKEKKKRNDEAEETRGRSPERRRRCCSGPPRARARPRGRSPQLLLRRRRPLTTAAAMTLLLLTGPCCSGACLSGERERNHVKKRTKIDFFMNCFFCFFDWNHTQERKRARVFSYWMIAHGGKSKNKTKNRTGRKKPPHPTLKSPHTQSSLFLSLSL